MLWERDVRVVVRLSPDSVTEAVARYIDDHGGNSWVMGHEELRVQMVDKHNNGVFLKRTLRVVKDTKVRNIEHYHLTNWTVNSANSCDQVVRLVLAAKEARNRLGATTPVLVHCGAGVGRTGTFITIWCMMESQQPCTSQTLEDKLTFIRKSRMSMVQTEDQYVFIYHCVTHYKNNPNKWNNQQVGK
ncbi:hypothetical protein Pmani_028440 [Petrolisthes manimaculis]|uniref:Uncharacterized protein n=1 Tax=Petrolisthes manimaculis TaxID=1843537 RepID=A0AAE1NZI0_9EUCA|nr:hypothetical protein Pmani_028440 [Petrolisthes manimaculis]